ncbi:hypothetical protein Pla52nx_002893 [Stieleria varia]
MNQIFMLRFLDVNQCSEPSAAQVPQNTEPRDGLTVDTLIEVQCFSVM